MSAADGKPEGDGAAAPRRIPRVPKGKRPTYFDPATDRLLDMVLALAGEVSVMRDRMETVERLIEKHGLFDRIESMARFLGRTAGVEAAELLVSPRPVVTRDLMASLFA